MGLTDIQYKETEIGIIPSDWELKKLSQVAMLEGGFAFSSKKFAANGEFQIIRMGNLYQGNLDLSRSSAFLSYLNPNEEHYLLKENDILITLTGTVGKKDYGFTYRIRKEQKLLLNQRVARLVVNENINPIYIDCQFKTNKILNQFFELAKGGTGNQANVGVKDIESIKIPIPPPNEQIAIATALSDTDALIESLEKLIEKKRNIKQGAMQELLKSKVGWSTKKLGDFLIYEQPTKYLVKDTEYNNNNQTPVLTAGKTFILGYTDEEFGIYDNIPVIIFDDFTTANKYVTFTFKAKSSAMKMLTGKNKEVNLRFMYEIMQTIHYPLSDHKRYWISEYQHIEIKVPSPEQQKSISEILSNMDTEIELLENKLHKYRMIKQGMMQVLLTGKIRLS